MADRGIALLDKPGGISSHDAVARLRRALGTKKVGHAGTLDPMATGLLLLGVGPSTRLLTHLVGLDKVYEATIRLGESTTTDDAEGELVERVDTSDVGLAQVEAGIAALTGAMQQRPSSVSAIKVDGVRAYQRVRDGETVELAARPVMIHAFTLLEHRADAGRLDLDVRVHCSSGTYIRALARDLGAALGVGGHLSRLRRTAIGPFDVADADPVPEWLPRGDAAAESAAVVAPPIRLLTPAAVATRLFPTLPLSQAQAADLAHGKRLTVEAADARILAATSPSGRLIGLVEVERGRTRVLTNFPVQDGVL